MSPLLLMVIRLTFNLCSGVSLPCQLWPSETRAGAGCHWRFPVGKSEIWMSVQRLAELA